MKKTKIIVWLNGSKYWNWVYLGNDGRLYIREENGKPGLLSGYVIDRLDINE